MPAFKWDESLLREGGWGCVHEDERVGNPSCIPVTTQEPFFFPFFFRRKVGRYGMEYQNQHKPKRGSK